MSGGMRGAFRCWLAVFTVAQAAAAQAPAYAPPPPPGVFPVIIETAEADSHPTYLLGYESAPPFVRCEGACSLWAYPARYTLSVRGEGYSESSRSFELTRPSRVLVEPRTTGQRNGGLVLGIVGIGLAVIGAAMVLSADNALGDDKDLFVPGVLSFAAGATLTPIGFVAYGRHRPGIRVEPL